MKQDVKQLSKAFRALSHPNRLQLFLNLWRESKLDLQKGRTHECFLVTLLGNMKVGAPTVSHHIRELESAGLISTSKEGKQLICSINRDAVHALKAMFEGI
jgi:ArsR family transcriptional regulator